MTRFFGRQQLLDELKAKVAQQPLVAVAVPTGSGASSLIFAGLIPLAKEGRSASRQPIWVLLSNHCSRQQPLIEPRTIIVVQSE